MDEIPAENLAKYLVLNDLKRCLRTNVFNLACQIGLLQGGSRVVVAVEKIFRLPPTGEFELLKINYRNNYISDRKSWKALPRLQRIRITARHNRKKRTLKLISKFKAEDRYSKRWRVEGMKGACEGGHRRMIKLFKKLGHRDNIQPIWHCAFGGHWELTEEFITLYSDRGDFYQRAAINQAMHGACRGGYLEKVREYMARGATDYRRGMLTATAEGHLDVIEYMYDLFQAEENEYYGLRRTLKYGLESAKRVKVAEVIDFYEAKLMETRDLSSASYSSDCC